ncbi:MAG: 16S rRNA (guanine(966)-N(2))-methyltransferase RsmD [Proteobacteria bacterium]|nr:16S rRNA (guanine(966)-N(2))-methyltransferase RsmD [Pseudomonadota bacterium]
MALRIIAGRFKGRRLRVPRGQAVRPTTERVREAVFDILGPRVAGAVVLDLFAGTGAMALEALSRGAARAVLIEANPESIRAANHNVEALEVADRVRIISRDARQGPGPGDDRFDLIFVDPPYGEATAAAALEGVGRSRRLHPDGIMIVEHAARLDLPDVTSHLERIDQRRYGRTCVSFYVCRQTEKKDSRR